VFSEWHDFLLSSIESPLKDGQLSIWYLGGAGIVLKTAHTTVYVDPFLGTSPHPSLLRMIPIPINPFSVTECDAILSTHKHLDHCHYGTIMPIFVNTGCAIVAPCSSARVIKEWGIPSCKLNVVGPGDEVFLGDLRIAVVQSADPQDPHAVAYLIQWRSKAIFHGGDTLYSHQFRDIRDMSRTGRIDVAFLSLGKNRERVIYLDAVSLMELAKLIGAQEVIPIHWDLWKRHLEDPTRVLALSHDDNRFKQMTVRILQIGDSLTIEENS